MQDPPPYTGTGDDLPKGYTDRLEDNQSEDGSEKSREC